MLDVHPPHSPTHTWKDFFIHIATIVIGLIIAVGLEQTVEAIHHHHQVQELREALKQERQENRRLFLRNVAYCRYNRAKLLNNLHILLYLQQHPGTPEEKLPGTLVWKQRYTPIVDSAYRNGEQSQTLAMLPQKEAKQQARFYAALTSVEQSGQAAGEAGVKASEYSVSDPDPSHLSPAQLEKTLSSLNDALFLNSKLLNWLWHVGADNSDFPGGPPLHEIYDINGWTRSPQDNQKLAAAEARTKQTLQATAAPADAAGREAAEEAQHATND
jgi:hypothetical protein